MKTVEDRNHFVDREIDIRSDLEYDFVDGNKKI